MADDPKAKQFTLNYAGGSITSTVGVFESLFGSESEVLNPVPTTETVTVKSHTRVRVIGQPATNVAGSFAGLGVFLAANSPKVVKFRSERGTKYGPYKKAS